MTARPLPGKVGRSRTVHEPYPLQLDEIEPRLLPGGRLLLLAAPGQLDPARGWARDLASDVRALRERGVDVLVSLLDREEVALLGVAPWRDVCKREGIATWWLPTVDRAVPDLERARLLVAKIVAALASGHAVAVCCRGGLGRTGTLAAFTLVACGIAADAAIAAVRTARPGAIETSAQAHAVQTFAPEHRG
jgi:ADP-ribosyl-[dinitrogen reductase] hydrolase